MDKQKIIIGSIGATIAVVAAGYFFITPTLQVSSYKEVVGTKHSELNESFNKVVAITDRDIFIKTDVEEPVIRSDIKAGNEAIKDVEGKLASVKNDLTGFSPLPLLDFDTDYKNAIQLKNDEHTYITKIEAFVNEMKAILTYFEKNADLLAKTTQFEKAVADAEDATSADDYAAKVNKAIGDITPTIDTLRTMSVPASLKEAHDYSVTATTELLTLYKQFAAAVKAENMDKMLDLQEKLSLKAEELVKKSAQYDADFARNSTLRKTSDSLRELDLAINRLQAGL